ncbi:hypothetical protein NPIL_671381, partial [Nephila pilipes]
NFDVGLFAIFSLLSSGTIYDYLNFIKLIIVTLFLAAMIYVAVADDSADTHITARVGKPLYIKEYTDPDGTVHFTQLEG